VKSSSQQRRHLKSDFLSLDRDSSPAAAPHLGEPHPQRELGPRRQGRHGDGFEQAKWFQQH
jgi:hypothetical protein